MDQHVLSIYLGEIETQCTFALNATQQLNQALNTLSGGENPTNDHNVRKLAQSEVFRSIHSLLTHASNVSRLLWPSRPKDSKAERGRILRKALGIPDDDYPLKSRRLRDHLEHFDERLDEWQETSAGRTFVQDNIGPWGSVAGVDELDVMRWYDQVARRLIFRGESIDIQELVTTIDALLPLAREASAQARMKAGQTSNNETAR